MKTLDEITESQELLDSEVPNSPIMPNLPLQIAEASISPSSDPIDNIYTDPEYKGNPLGQTILTGPGSVPLTSTLPNPVPKPGYFETIAHYAGKMNNLALAGQLAYDAFTSTSAVDEVPEGWTAKNVESVEGFPREYWEYLIDAKSPNDLIARQERVRRQMVDDEKFASGSLTASLLGGFVGVVSDPLTYLLPMASSAKYATIGQNVLMNMGRASSGIALESVSRNMLTQADRAGGNIQDMATDSLRDIIFGVALVGAGAAIGGGLRQAKLWESRKVMNYTADGVKLDYVVDEEGKIVGAKAEMMPGVPMNAQALSAAQLYANDELLKTGVLGLPFIGESIHKFLGWGPLASPVFKFSNSKYKSAKNFFNRIASHGVILKGEEEGIAKADTASDFLEAYRDEARSLTQFIRGQFYEANGLEGGTNVKNALKNFQQTITNNRTISQERFGQEIRNIAYVEGYKSEYAQAHVAAEQVLKFFEKLGKEYHAAVGEGGEFLDPRTAWKYLPQNYNIEAMINNPDKWTSTAFIELSKQDARIRELQAPLREAEQSIEALQAQIKELSKSKGSENVVRGLKNQLRQAKARAARHENEMINNLRTSADDSILLEDRIMFDESEREQFNNFLQPVRDAERQKVIIESKLKPFLKEQKINPRDNKINLEVKRIKAELEKAEQEIATQKQALEDAVYDGKVEKKFYYMENGEVKFHDPNRKPKFRRLFESENELRNYVNQAYDSIVGQSPEDLLSSILGTVSPGIIENPKYLHARTLPINSQAFNEVGLLDPDIAKSVTNYANTMGKIIAFKKAFPEYATEKGFEGPVRYFKLEHEEFKNKILQEKPGPEREKKLQKLDKEFRKTQELMSDTYKVFMGTYESGNPQLTKFVRAAKNLVAASKLGSVPVYQIVELGAIVMKQGLMPFLAQGLRPMIKSLNRFDKASKEEREAIRQNASNAYLALYNVQNGYADMFINRGSMSSAPVKTIWGRAGVATENLAHMSGNIYGINMIANINEQIAANIFQSEAIQVALAYKAGTATKKQIAKMAHYGIDMDKWADRFAKGYKDAGGWELAGGHQSQYYKWQDAEAANRLSMSMRRMVHDTVVNRNAFSSPYWSNNPLLSMVFMFHGWAYGALNHYAVPLMQRPDAENMLGLVTIVGMSLLAEPFLRLANGKPAYDDDTKWFDEAYKALDYSGMLGPYASMLQDVNNVFGGSLVPGLQTERAKNRGAGFSGLGGPVIGYANDVASSITHNLRGDMTQNDAKREFRLSPFASLIPLRYAVNDYIDNSDLPKTRGQAHAWNWRQETLGEK